MQVLEIFLGFLIRQRSEFFHEILSAESFSVQADIRRPTSTEEIADRLWFLRADDDARTPFLRGAT